AEEGSGLRDTATLHRIDPEAVKKEVTSAGYKFEGASAVLRNNDDPHTAKVFDPAIRGPTDQSIFRFRKPRRGAAGRGHRPRPRSTSRAPPDRAGPHHP